MSAKIVTGYVPIPGHPRSAKVYGELGERLGRVPVPKKAFYSRVKDTWLYRHVHSIPHAISHSVGDNPEKNSLAYHCVQHEKVSWMLQAAKEDPIPDVFIWVDYGVFNLPGVTEEAITAFVERAGSETGIAIPGCMPKAFVVQDKSPYWRFCGTVLVCRAEYLSVLDTEIKATVRRHLRATDNVDWEVNTWARVEAKTKLPIRWYAADHNGSLFTNYGAPNVGAFAGEAVYEVRNG